MKPSATELAPGCQLVTPRYGFTHHGIYVGDGMVVHYAGLSRSLRRGPVELVSLEDFAGGRDVWVEPTPRPRYAGIHAVARALSRLNEDRYRIATNNCEHFCAWCLEGVARSKQIEQFLEWPRAAARTLFARFTQALWQLPNFMNTSPDRSACD